MTFSQVSFRSLFGQMVPKILCLGHQSMVIGIYIYILHMYFGIVLVQTSSGLKRKTSKSSKLMDFKQSSSCNPSP